MSVLKYSMHYGVFGLFLCLFCPLSQSATLSVGNDARFGGDFGLRVAVNDTTAGFVQDDTPNAESLYTARGYVRTDALSMGGGDEISVLTGHSAGGTVHFEVLIKESGGALVASITARENNGAVQTTGNLPLNGSWHLLEIAWAAGSGSGTATLKVDNGSQVQIASLTNNLAQIDFIRWGAVTGSPASTFGHFDLDDFSSVRGGTIGPLPLAQYGVGFFDPDGGAFFLRDAFAGGAADSVFAFGPGGLGWQAIGGDWDGIGLSTVGLYDPVNGGFFLRNAHAGGNADEAFNFGPGGLGWWPIAGDWDGNGTTTVGLYDPSSGAFFLRNAHSGGNADEVFSFGPGGLGWWPIAGDWDNNGTTTVGLYDPASGAFFLRNAHSGGNADEVFNFGPGGLGWEPIAGDWNGNGMTTIGLYDPATSQFFLKNSHAGGNADVSFNFGPSGTNWQPIAGDWDTQ